MANEVKDVNTSPASGAVDVGTAADVDEMMKKFDRESNIRHPEEDYPLPAQCVHRIYGVHEYVCGLG